MSFRSIFISFALLGLFMYGIISFGVGIANDNNSNNSILNDPTINKTFRDLEEDLGSFQSTTQGQKDNFEGQLPSEGFGELIFTSLISGGQVFTGLIFGVFNILAIPFKTILGFPPIVIGVLTSILIITMLLTLWRLVKTGE